jgi:hypothetical protein
MSEFVVGYNPIMANASKHLGPHSFEWGVNVVLVQVTQTASFGEKW